MTFEDFVVYNREMGGRVLTTLARGARFVVRVGNESIFYTPESTGIERRHTFKFAKRVFERYEKTGSLKPVDYQNISKNVSYMLTLIAMYTKSKK
jgi:hypothetical protein